MEYIEPKEFLKQPKKVQKELRNWWKPEIHDLFFRSFGDSPNSFLNGIYIGHIGDNETKNNATAYKDFLPVLTEGQLRKYIEDKICNSKITTEYYLEGYKIFMLDANNDEKPLRDFETNETDLLKAYWQVACKIAEEE